jgi:hypothetical protein
MLWGDGSCNGAIGMTPKCARCDNTHWVCDLHADKPWDGGTSLCACKCGAPDERKGVSRLILFYISAG